MPAFGTRSRKTALAALFGAAIFVLKIALPFPLDKFLVVFQGLFLALGSLLMGVLGATFVSLVGGILTALLRGPKALSILIFALLYGVLVDGFIFVFRVRSSKGEVKPSRMIASLAVSSSIVGLASYYTSVFVVKILPRNPIMELAVLVAGLINGSVAVYVAAYMWRKTLKRLEQTIN